MKENRKGKKWAVLIMAALLWMGMVNISAPMHAMAAQQAQPVSVTTTQRCSIWSAPATAEENRVKYVDDGYQITVYPEVIQSEAGDGKTFYRTIGGAYVLCKCVTGEAENGAPASGSAAIGGSAPAMPVMPELPVFDNTASVVTWRQGGSAEGSRKMNGYDAAGNEIRFELYVEGNRLLEIGVTEYDAAGRWKKTLYCEYRDYNHDIWSQTPVERILWFLEYDVAGNEIRTTTFDAETGRATQEYVDEWDAAGNRRRISDTQWWSYEGFEDSIRRIEYGYDAAGNKITREITEYRADGTIESYNIEQYDAAGHTTGTRSVFYNPDGAVREYWISEYNEKGVQLKLTRYDGNGTVIEYTVHELDAEGNGTGLFTTYDGNGKKKR